MAQTERLPIPGAAKTREQVSPPWLWGCTDRCPASLEHHLLVTHIPSTPAETTQIAGEMDEFLTFRCTQLVLFVFSCENNHMHLQHLTQLLPQHSPCLVFNMPWWTCPEGCCVSSEQQWPLAYACQMLKLNKGTTLHGISL